MGGSVPKEQAWNGTSCVGNADDACDFGNVIVPLEGDVYIALHFEATFSGTGCADTECTKP